MRVLLATWSDQLLQKLQILNPQLEYCAIVVDEVEPAQKVLERLNMPKSLLRPMYELKDCVRDFFYDYVLCVDMGAAKDLINILKGYGVTQNKIVVFNVLGHSNFSIERNLRYFKEHAAEFDMFATGLSYVEVGLDITRFKRKLFNFGRSSQDLYYNFEIAKRAVAYGGGHGKLRYALIGLAAYIFHFDLSRTPNNQVFLLSHLIALNDLHNFYVPTEVYGKFFRKEYLMARLPLEPFDLNNPFGAKKPLFFMTPEKRLDARRIIDVWIERNFPDTRAENVQILDDYLTLCEANNIRPIMLLPPTTEGYKKCFSKQRLDEFHYLVRQACQKHPGAIFLDGWQLQGLTDRDFYDVSHMNIMGAAKFSMWLNQFIEQLDGNKQ